MLMGLIGLHLYMSKIMFLRQLVGSNLIFLSLQVPVGRATLGRIINVIGEPIDEKGDLSKNLVYPILSTFLI